MSLIMDVAWQVAYKTETELIPSLSWYSYQANKLIFVVNIRVHQKTITQYMYTWKRNIRLRLALSVLPVLTGPAQSLWHHCVAEWASRARKAPAIQPQYCWVKNETRHAQYVSRYDFYLSSLVRLQSQLLLKCNGCPYFRPMLELLFSWVLYVRYLACCNNITYAIHIICIAFTLVLSRNCFLFVVHKSNSDTKAKPDSFPEDKEYSLLAQERDEHVIEVSMAYSFKQLLLHEDILRCAMCPRYKWGTTSWPHTTFS